MLVTVDTLRADHIGAYGSNVETPNFDRFAAEGALAEQVSAHVPLTRPSHVSLMSGLLPTETGVRDNVTPAPVPDVPLLAEVLGDAGFETGAFVSAVVVSRASGLGRGFDHYSDDFTAGPNDPRFLNTAQKRGDETLAEAQAWLEARFEAGDTSRIFLWLHLYDPHEPYDPPEPHASKYRDRPYAGEVAWTDELLGSFDDTLERLGIQEETLLVVTSDHGEGLGEHNELLHGFFAYETTLRVPLIFRGPGIVPGRRLQHPKGLVDLFPTILDLVDVEAPAGRQRSGRNWASALRGGEELPIQPVYAETLVPQLKFGWSDLRVVRDERYKYIQAPRPELYDLVADPSEQSNVIRQERQKARELRDALSEHLERERIAAESLQQADGETSGELLEQLAALGYVGSQTASTASPDADPKDKIEDFRTANALLRAALVALHAADPATAVEHLNELRALGVDSAEIQLNLGRALLGMRRYDEAAENFMETVARLPQHAEAWLGVAETQSASGNLDGALEALRNGQQQLPENLVLRREEARLLRLAKRPQEAKQVLENAIEMAPSDAFLRAGLSEVLVDLGDGPGALASLRQAVDLAPEQAEYHNALGTLLAGLGQMAEAGDAFREAWRLETADPRYGFNFGLALEQQGKTEDAAAAFEQVIALHPSFAPAQQRLQALRR